MQSGQQFNYTRCDIIQRKADEVHAHHTINQYIRDMSLHPDASVLHNASPTAVRQRPPWQFTFSIVGRKKVWRENG